MKRTQRTTNEGAEMSEVLILPDGRILAHNITPEMASVLTELDPGNEAMQRRAAAGRRAKKGVEKAL